MESIEMKCKLVALSVVLLTGNFSKSPSITDISIQLIYYY